MNTIAEIIEFLILYFQFRNIHRWDYVPYKSIKSLMTYITGIKETETLRNIFEQMVKSGHFLKRKIRSCTDYMFIFDAKK